MQRSPSGEDVIAYHDTNRDGLIQFEEFRIQNERWKRMEEDALAGTPEDLLRGMSKQELHYERLEDSTDGRRFKQLQRETMAEENQIRQARERAKSDL